MYNYNNYCRNGRTNGPHSPDAYSFDYTDEVLESLISPKFGMTPNFVHSFAHNYDWINHVCSVIMPKSVSILCLDTIVKGQSQFVDGKLEMVCDKFVQNASRLH